MDLSTHIQGYISTVTFPLDLFYLPRKNLKQIYSETLASLFNYQTFNLAHSQIVHLPVDIVTSFLMLSSFSTLFFITLYDSDYLKSLLHPQRWNYIDGMLPIFHSKRRHFSLPLPSLCVKHNFNWALRALISQHFLLSSIWNPIFISVPYLLQEGYLLPGCPQW